MVVVFGAFGHRRSNEEHLRDAADAVGTDLGGTLVLNHRGTWPPSFRLAHFTPNLLAVKSTSWLAHFTSKGFLFALLVHFFFALLVHWPLWPFLFGVFLFMSFLPNFGGILLVLFACFGFILSISFCWPVCQVAGATLGIVSHFANAWDRFPFVNLCSNNPYPLSARK